MEAAATVVVVVEVLELLELLEPSLLPWWDAAVVPEVVVAAWVVLVLGLLTARRDVAVVAVAAIAPTTASMAETLAVPATTRARHAGWRRRPRSGTHRPAVAVDWGTCRRLPALLGSGRSTGLSLSAQGVLDC